VGMRTPARGDGCGEGILGGNMGGNRGDVTQHSSASHNTQYESQLARRGKGKGEHPTPRLVCCALLATLAGWDL
jgi:hypothetical protein